MDYRKVFIRIQPYIALGIFLILLLLCVLLYQENKITTKISKDCGWEGEDFRCICEKSEVIRMQNFAEEEMGGIVIINVPSEIMNNWSIDNVTLDS